MYCTILKQWVKSFVMSLLQKTINSFFDKVEPSKVIIGDVIT